MIKKKLARKAVIKKKLASKGRRRLCLWVGPPPPVIKASDVLWRPVKRERNKHPIMRFSTASFLLTTIASAALRPYLAAASVSSAVPDDAQASEYVTDGKCTCNICQL